MQRAVIVQGLGFGDEGKGATVDFLARELRVDLVVRYCGGSQAGHNVVLPDGRRHTFSQFGAGTLAGAATFLGEQMIINPPALDKEAQHLVEMTGRDPFLKLAVHPRALVTTTFHQQLNRLRERSRGASRHGSCGHGIGETRSYWLKYGSDAIFAADLQDRQALRGKLELVRQRALIEAQQFVGQVPDEDAWRFELLLQPTQPVARDLEQLGRPLAFEDTVPACTTAIFEGAQGVLLDEWRGFHPYTTWSTVTLHHAMAMLEASAPSEVCTLGVTRAFMTRHGAGPLPSHTLYLDSNLSDPGNPTNAWQGTIRHGWLDLVLLRYSAEVTGGLLDGIVVNGLDQLTAVSPCVCTAYKSRVEMDGRRLPVSPAPSLQAQEKLTRLLQQAVPICEPVSPAAICKILADQIAPIAITASGATWQDRILRELRFRSSGKQASDRWTEGADGRRLCA